MHNHQSTGHSKSGLTLVEAKTEARQMMNKMAA